MHRIHPLLLALLVLPGIVLPGVVVSSAAQNAAPAPPATKPVAPASQNPSPMVEHTRAHQRLTKPAQPLPGTHTRLSLGTLFLPQKLNPHRPATLLLFFLGGDWVPEVAVAQQHQMAVLTVNNGAGSGNYTRLFADPTHFPALIDEAEKSSGIHFSQIALGGWSAGCGAIRQILLDPAGYARVNRVLCIDGVHTGYTHGTPGPLESDIDTSNLQMWLHFGQDAMAGKKRLIITHTEIFPGTFASTTETADWLLSQWHLTPTPTARFGPRGTQMLSRAASGGLLVLGFAGNSAPDHVDQFHSLPEYLNWLMKDK